MFVDAHRALGPDHWQMVLRDFLAIFERTDPDDFPDARAPVDLVHYVIDLMERARLRSL